MHAGEVAHGKSRLGLEFTHWLELLREPVSFFLGRPQPYGNNFPYGQFIINPSTIVTVNDLTIGDALLYRQGYTLGATSATVSQWFATGFVQIPSGREAT